MVRQKKVIVSRSPDEIREDILRFFYDTHKSASSPKQIRLKITDVKRGLKAMGISGKEAMTNIDYLIEGGWIKKEVETKQIPTPKGGVYPAATSYYKASNKTIDHLQVIKIPKSRARRCGNQYNECARDNNAFGRRLE